MTRRGWFLFAALSVVWGIPYLLIRIAVRDLSPALLVFLRTAIGGAILLPLARRSLKSLRSHWRAVLAYTVAEVAIPWVLLSDAEKRLPSSLAGLFVAAVPMVGAIFAATLRGRGHERLEARRVIGLVTGFVGVGVVVGLSVPKGELSAVAEMLVVVLGYATGPLLISRLLVGVPVVAVVTASLLGTALVYAPFAAAALPATVPSAEVLVAVALLSVLCTALAFVLFFRLIAEVGPVRTTLVTYVNLAVAVALGVVLLNEPFTIATGVGFVLIFLGSFLATRPLAAARSTSAAA